MQQERKARDGPGGRRKGATTTSLTSAIFMGRAKRGEGGDVSQHSQSYKFQEPSMPCYTWGRLGTCDGMVREGGLKLLTRHEVGSFIIMTTAMWLWFSHSGSAGTDCRDERASREEGLQSGRQANKTSSLPLLGFFLFAALLLPLSFGPSSLGVGSLSF